MGDSEKVIVVGAGPVGSLAALYAANRGHAVEIYELRSGEFSQALFVVTWPLAGVATKHGPK